MESTETSGERTGAPTVVRGAGDPVVPGAGRVHGGVLHIASEPVLVAVGQDIDQKTVVDDERYGAGATGWRDTPWDFSRHLADADAAQGTRARRPAFPKPQDFCKTDGRAFG